MLFSTLFLGKSPVPNFHLGPTVDSFVIFYAVQTDIRRGGSIEKAMKLLGW